MSDVPHRGDECRARWGSLGACTFRSVKATVRELRRRVRVARGLARIERHERAGEKTGRKLTARARQRASAGHSLAPLHKWEKVSDRSYAAYTREASVARISRLLELIPPGSRILDIGIGFGYVTGILLRDLDPSYYCGVDLRDTFLDATRDMIAHNELDDRVVELEILDIFDIDEDFARRHDPDVVLLLEVLEHVADPAGALRAVAAAVRPGTTVMFSVPLRGRLDGVWGHASVFDSDRLRRICEEAGLQIERAEPIHSTWSLIVATTGGAPPGSDDDSVPDRDEGDGDSGYTFSTVPVNGPPKRYRRPSDGPNVKIRSSRAYLRCVVRPRDGDRTGGVRLKMPNPRVARMEISVRPPDRVRSLRIQGLDEAGTPRLEWAISNDATGRRIGERTTYVLRPGERARDLDASGAKDAQGVRWMEVTAEPEPDAKKLVLTVHRAAYLGDDGE
jgi:2-polyprenyl-3-methyl-5-hydroxy-6-metoxy-1,4-benzoquinol methylase